MRSNKLLTMIFLFSIIVSIAILWHVDIIGKTVNNKKQCAILAKLNLQIDGGAVIFVERAISESKNRRCILIVEIDSYGGYVSAADKIVENILRNSMDCYSWIPPGGKAVSAAAMIALACNRIYMGAGSSIGAAKPIPANEKTIEYVASRFRALAEKMFNGNKTLVNIAESMVRNSTSLSFDEAIKLGFAKPANSVDEVLADINAYLEKELEPSYWEKLVSLVSDPSIASIMLSIGALLIMIEVLVTGFQGYVIAGVLLIVLALYGMTIIPPDLLTLALLLCGAILLAIEIYTPGFGAFGITGIVLLAIGTYMLFSTKPPETLTALNITVAGGLLSFGGLIAFVAYKAAKTLKMKRPRLEEILVGSIGIAKTDIGETQPGVVYVANEEWTAFSVRGTIKARSKVRVVRVEGLKLYVEKISE